MTTTTLTPEELAARAALDQAIVTAAAALMAASPVSLRVRVTGAAHATIWDDRIVLTGTAEAPISIDVDGRTSAAGAAYLRALAERDAAGAP